MSGDVVDAVVVGSGPNGLTAAALLASEGRSVLVLEAAETIGGGTRTEELTLPGVLHDVCSAGHPFGAASPAFAALDLEAHGLRWCHSPVGLAHPLDGGRVAVMHRSVAETASGLGVDERAWRRTFGPLAEGFGTLNDELMGPILHVPRHPVLLARFGLGALQPATLLARRWQGDEARALFGGIAAHAIHSLSAPTSAAVGLMMGTAGHVVGWPVAEGGSAAISRALASIVESNGGTIETGVRVGSLADLPPHRAALFDVAPGAFADIAEGRQPARIARAYRRYRHGPAAFKVDLAVEGGLPWLADAASKAATVHLGGTFEEIVAAEADVVAGRMPERPFVLLGQQHLADPTRSAGDIHPIWAYAHVPHGWAGDATEAVLAQIERFAPGARERVVASAVRGPATLAAHNANYVGGDIATGANSPLQVVFRPRLALDPYATGVDDTWLCSAATPPGAGVHGMAGWQVAQRALHALQRG